MRPGQPAPAPPGPALLALAPLALAAGLAPLLLGWIAVAPNRLLSPRPAALAETGPVLAAWALFHAALLALLLAAWRPRPNWLPEAAAVLAILALAATVGLGTAAGLPPGAAIARAAPAAGAWVALLALALATAAASAIRGGTPAIPLLAALLGIGVLGASGLLDALSLVREAHGRAADLGAALAGHLALSFSALLLALLVALPLATLSLSRPRLEAAFLGAASGIQVIPSIALFGLLIAPLAALAAAFPALREAGLGGVGPAPAVIGIAAYLVLPLGRGILTGLRVAPHDLVEAARGQGLSPGQVLRQLRLPLGAGVMLGALRLGAVVFQGIGQLASDLILLGVLPILALSLAADAGLALLARFAPGGA